MASPVEDYFIYIDDLQSPEKVNIENLPIIIFITLKLSKKKKKGEEI